MVSSEPEKLGFTERRDDSPPRSPKRRRTYRACDICKRRKIKCDGTSPCASCTSGGFECTYGDKVRQNSGPTYLQHLERKVQELEALLRHPESASKLRQHRSDPSRTRSEPVGTRQNYQPPAQLDHNSNSQDSARYRDQTASSEDDDDIIETIVSTSDGAYRRPGDSENVRGQFAGLSLLQRIRSLCSDLSGQRDHAEDDESCQSFADAFDIASPDEKHESGSDSPALLPTKDKLFRRLDVAFDQALALMYCIDRDEIADKVHRLYDKEPDDYDKDDRKSLALIYALLALGRRFENDDTKPSEGDARRCSDKQSTKGLRYIRASRDMMDITDCHDVMSLRTVLCMVVYLQSTSMMSTCYSYICAAVAASLRMGLHLSYASQHLSVEERTAQRRLFAVLNMMDTYVTTALGLPKTLRDIDSDHLLLFPANESAGQSARVVLDDPTSLDAATHAHAKLILILSRAVENNYPVTRPPFTTNGFYSVQYQRIAQIEADLEQWLNNLPDMSTPSAPASTPRFIRSQLLLRLAYAHVQMVLYRPFLHHVMKSSEPGRIFHYKAYACGSACVKAAMQVVWLAQTLDSHGALNEAYWFTIYILSFAATSLMFFVLSSDGDPTIRETAEAAENAKGLLRRLARYNRSAQRCYESLNELHVGKSVGRAESAVAEESRSETDDGHRRPRTPAREEDQSANEHEAHEIQAMTYPRVHPYLDEM
ncbi:Gypsy retrotransposon integrase-like protein 1 [Elasticomyces elasticus]|nr:Gypsy retrotransposon integrase-like protein 1 [Elasticomyces elasticus]